MHYENCSTFNLEHDASNKLLAKNTAAQVSF